MFCWELGKGTTNMPVALAKDSIDVGIVVADADKALAFYRDLLGFELQNTVQMGDFITQYRLSCGASVVKLNVPSKAPPPMPPRTGPPLLGLTELGGIRYWTISVTNLDDVVEQVRAAGHAIALETVTSTVVPGLRIAIVEDPERNLVELVEMSA